MGQRVFSAIVAAATILSMMGIAAFAVPQQAQAAGAGDLVTASLSAVYFVGYDGARYTFPNSATFNTWYTDFNDVMTISDSAMADISLGGNVVYRAGSHWVKIQSDARTYAVSTDGMIHWIESEAVAVGLAGSNWSSNIHDVADTFFVDYTTGTSLADASLWEGALYMDGSDKMIVWGGEARMLTSAGSNANNFMSEYYLDGADVDASAFGAGSDITGEVCDLVDASQTGCSVVATEGDVSVSLSSSTPAGATVPGGANSVEVFEFDVEAGSDAANINIMTFTMKGIGASTDITNVYLYEGSTRLTEARSVNASTRSVTFGSLNLDLSAGETRTLSLRVELSSSALAGNEFNFTIDSMGDVTADGDVDGNFPVAGNTFQIATQNSGTITITKNGTISNPSLGEQDAVIGQFNVAAATENAMLEEITLKIDNSADHSDYKLWDGNVLVASGEYIGNKLVMFDLSSSPFSIQEGNSNVFKVSADIGGEAADGVGVYVDNSADILAVGGDYGFGMTVYIASADSGSYDGATSCDEVSDDCSYSTVQGGEVTFSLAGPSTGEVRTNSQDQVLLEFTITAAQAVTVRDLDILIYADDDADNDAMDGQEADTDVSTDGLIGASEANVSDIKIVNAATGTVLMGPLELDSAADGGNDAVQTIDFTDDFGMDAGETLTLQVKVDVDNDIASGTELGATVSITSGLVIEDANGDNLTTATDVVPSSNLIGNNQEALAASLTAALASIPGDTTTVQGAKGVHAQSFSLLGGDAGVVNISNIIVSVYAHDATATPYQLGDCDDSGACASNDVDVNDFISSCSIYDVDGNLLDGPNTPTPNGQTINFDDVDWAVAASENERIDLYCDIANPSDATTAYFAFEMRDSSTTGLLDITALDDDGTAVTIADVNGLNGETSPTNVVTVEVSGSLALAAAASMPSADYVLSGSSDNFVAAFDYTATNEAFEIKKVVLTEEAAEVMDGVSNSAAYTNNISTVTVEYPAEDGLTYTKTATFGGENEASVSFAGTSAEPYMYAGTADAATLNVYVDVPATDRATGGNSSSNDRIEIGLAADVAGDFDAVSAGSDTSLDGTGSYSSTAANKFIVRETTPTITLASSSPAGTGFVPGDQEAFRFNVAANSNEDLVMNEFVFSFAATDNDGTEGTTDNQPDWNECDSDVTSGYGIYASMLDIYDMSDEGLASALDVDADWSILGEDAVACSATQADVGFFELSLTTALVIPAGETHAIALYFDSSRANAANDDSIQITIPTDPIVSLANFIDVGASGEVTGAELITSTTFEMDGSGESSYNVGDVGCLTTSDSDVDDNDGTCASGDELVLVTAVTGTTSLTVVRGYLNTAPAATTTFQDLDVVPSTLLWQDDGTTAVTESTEEYWGSYLVDNLPITGGAMGF